MENPAQSSEPEALLSRLLDDQLSELERDALLAHLRQNPAALTTLREHLALADTLSRHLDPSRSAEAFASSVRYRIEHDVDQNSDAFARQIGRRIETGETRWHPFQALSLCGALAAVFALAFAWANPNPARLNALAQRSAPVQTAELPVARVALTRDLVQANITLTAESAAPTRKLITFASGVVRLDFANGAIVSIEGPAAFTVRNGMELELQRGRLNAYCPVTAKGFRVLTPSAQLIDRGTSFGVDATHPERSNILVFDGIVDVAARQIPEHALRLFTGESSTIVPSSTPQAAPFEPSPYRQVWPITSGIIATSGGIRPPSPDVPLRLMDYESDDSLLVIPEKRHVQLTAPIPVNPIPASTGAIRGTFEQEIETLTTTARLRSYICYYNPVGTPLLEGFRHFQGSITFDAPILAVIYGTKQLRQSDALFQHERRRFPDSMRGLEDNEGQAPPDLVLLSPDRRTLTLDLFTGPHSDQIRVILAEDTARL